MLFRSEEMAQEALTLKKEIEMGIDSYADMVEKHSWTFLETCISKGAVVENALELYKPVIKHRSSSQIAQDYIDLAQELLAVLEV